MKFKIILVALAFAGLMSCGDDVDCTDTTALNTTISSATNALNAAISTWNGSDQLEDQCKLLKDGYNDYIDALEDIQDCATDLPGLITNARKELNKLACS